MSPTKRPLRWYAACRAFLLLPEPLRPSVSRQNLAHYRKIQALPRDLGEDLDRRAAPYAVFQWIAWGATEAERRARHALVRWSATRAPGAGRARASAPGGQRPRGARRERGTGRRAFSARADLLQVESGPEDDLADEAGARRGDAAAEAELQLDVVQGLDVDDPEELVDLLRQRQG